MSRFFVSASTSLLSGIGALACFGQAYEKIKLGVINTRKMNRPLKPEEDLSHQTQIKLSEVVLDFLESAAWMAGGGVFSWVAFQNVDQQLSSPNPNLEESAFYHDLTRKELETLSLNPFRHAINEQTPLDAEPPVFPEPCFPEAPSKACRYPQVQN